MLTFDDLVRLDRETRGTDVLTVYLPAQADGASRRESSRARLDAELLRLRDAEAAAHGARPAALSAATSALTTALGALPVGDQPIVAFATESGTLFAERVLAPVPFIACWRKGVVLAPYVRSLKQEHPVVLVAVDGGSSRLFRYQGGDVVLLDAFDAVDHEEPWSSMTERLTGQQTTESGTDDRERRHAGQFERMVRHIADRVETERSRDPWLVVGGTRGSVHLVLRALPRHMVERSTVAAALTTKSSLDEVARVASVAASELTARRDGAWVEWVLDGGSRQLTSAIGLPDVRRALEARTVHLLLVSANLVDAQALAADALVREAMLGGTAVEIVTGAGASRLDAEGGGVAAELRLPRDGGAAQAKNVARTVELSANV